MELLKKLKEHSNDKDKYIVYLNSIGKHNQIVSIQSEIFSFYEQDNKNKYLSVFFKLRTKEDENPITLGDMIDILEFIKNDTVVDCKFFKISEQYNKVIKEKILYSNNLESNSFVIE